MVDIEKLNDVIEHLEWAIQTSKSEVTFGMGKDASARAREIRLRGSAREASKLLKKIRNDLKENGHVIE